MTMLDADCGGNEEEGAMWQQGASAAHGEGLADIFNELYVDEPGDPSDDGDMVRPSEAHGPSASGMTISMIGNRPFEFEMDKPHPKRVRWGRRLTALEMDSPEPEPRAGGDAGHGQHPHAHATGIAPRVLFAEVGEDTETGEVWAAESLPGGRAPIQQLRSPLLEYGPRDTGKRISFAHVRPPTTFEPGFGRSSQCFTLDVAEIVDVKVSQQPAGVRHKKEWGNILHVIEFSRRVLPPQYPGPSHIKTVIQQPRAGSNGTTVQLMAGRRYRLNVSEFLETFPSWSISAWRESDNVYDVYGNQLLIPATPRSAKSSKTFSFCVPPLLSPVQQSLQGVRGDDSRAQARVYTVTTYVTSSEAFHVSMRPSGPAFQWPF
jgi:hypothetical protein